MNPFWQMGWFNHQRVGSWGYKPWKWSYNPSNNWYILWSVTMFFLKNKWGWVKNYELKFRISVPVGVVFLPSFCRNSAGLKRWHFSHLRPMREGKGWCRIKESSPTNPRFSIWNCLWNVPNCSVFVGKLFVTGNLWWYSPTDRQIKVLPFSSQHHHQLRIKVYAITWND